MHADLNDDTPVYVISVAAQIAGLHPQTLRQYDRLGLVSPGRTAGRGRRYSARDIRQLREIQRLSQEGVSLAGVKRILELENEVAELRQRVCDLEDELRSVEAAQRRREAAVHMSYRRDLVPLPKSGALVVWRPQPRRQAWT